VEVQGNGLVIWDGDVSPSTTDHTDFGTATQGQPGPTQTFTVYNTGTATLTLGTVNAPTGFSVVEGLPASLDAGASDTFTVRLDTATGGTKTGDITFTNNDSNENPFNFRIKGTVQALPAEIVVLCNGISITDGDTTPAADDGTDFGSVAQGSAPIERTFTVRNDGGSNLIVGWITVPYGFTLVEGLSTVLAPGASDTFTVRLSTTTIATRSGQISFLNNDGDETPFNFSIVGRILTPQAPEVEVQGNGLVIWDGDVSPSTTDHTDFGTATQGEPGPTQTFTVYNTGTATLTLGMVNVPTGFSVVEDLPASLDAGASDTFTVRLDTATGGTKTGDITFTNNDSNENPFNFRIKGAVQALPAEIVVLCNGISITDGDTTPTADDGTDFGSVARGSAPIERTFTVRNEGGSNLIVGWITVPYGFTLVEGLSTVLAPGASDSFTVRLNATTVGARSGQISFLSNDSDETPFNFSILGRIVAPPAL